MIKTTDLDKFYIEQVLIDTENNPVNWTPDKLVNLTKNNSIIGYFFSNSNQLIFGEPTKILNLYLINTKRYFNQNGDMSNIVELEELRNSYLEFDKKLSDFAENHQCNVFKNVPIQQWLDSKDNWIKRETSKMSNQFKLTYDEALSEIYYTILRLFKKKNVYMGNLGYVQTAITNNFLLNLRYDKNRVYGLNRLIDSLDFEIADKDGSSNGMTLGDIVGCYDKEYAEQDARDFEQCIRLKLSKDFSVREVDQILNNTGYLPLPLYRRLLKWRKCHTVSELLEV